MQEPYFQIRRRLNFRVAGKTKRGKLVIGDLRKVQTDGKADAWACSWLLSETDPEPRDIYGEDALAALVNCLAFVTEHIRNYEESGIEIWWLEKRDFGGLKPFLAEEG